jgi:hypothetical protein
VLHHLSGPAPQELDEDERQVIAFCAWLPDETRELSATGVFADAVPQGVMWLPWYPACGVERLFGGCPTNLPVSVGGPLVIVQQLLHGLTGGDSEAVTKVAGRLMMSFRQRVSAAKAANEPDYPNLLCALGLSIHLYGDSFAHRQLGTAETEKTMYDTVWGHTRDRHHPDHPCIARNREQAWAYDARVTGWLFDRQWPSVDSPMNAELDYIGGDEHCVGASDPGSNDNDDTLRNLLSSQLSGARQRFLPPDHYVLGDACEDYVRRNRNQGVIPQLRFTCHRTWEIYKPAAQREFFSVPEAIGSKYPSEYYNSVPLWRQ